MQELLNTLELVIYAGSIGPVVIGLLATSVVVLVGARASR